MASNKDSQPDPQRSQRKLYAEFEIEIAAGNSCPFDEFEADIRETNQQITNGKCHTDTTLSNNGCDCGDSCTEVVHTVSQIESTCFCPVFLRFDCLPRVTAVDSDSVRVETYLPDRKQLSDLVAELKSVSGGINLRRLRAVESDTETDPTETAVVDLHKVTEKQRKAALTAVSVGYYQRPRDISLEELADELGISKSACSQRLNAVESKLALAAFADPADSSTNRV
jgi:predicted DNA binding protein